MLKMIQNTAIMLACLLLLACSPQVHERDLYVFGTVMNVTITGVDSATAKRLFDALARQSQGMHDRWHAWQSNEVASITTACQTGKPMKLSDEIRYLLVEGQKLERMSDGYFNPAIGQLIDAWGFLSSESTVTRERPSKASLAQILAAHPSMADLKIEGHILRCHNPAVRVDMGAYAKGYALSLFMDYLKVQGVRSALINVGGDMYTLGDKQGIPWRIAIRSPQGNKPMAELSASEDESIVTSGVYERAFKNAAGETFHHVINPKTGEPSDHFVSTTVVHADPMVADAAATALLAADEENWQNIAQKMGVTQVLLVDKYGKVWVSEDMQARLTWF